MYGGLCIKNKGIKLVKWLGKVNQNIGSSYLKWLMALKSSGKFKLKENSEKQNSANQGFKKKFIAR